MHSSFLQVNPLYVDFSGKLFLSNFPTRWSLNYFLYGHIFPPHHLGFEKMVGKFVLCYLYKPSLKNWWIPNILLPLIAHTPSCLWWNCKCYGKWFYSPQIWPQRSKIIPCNSTRTAEHNEQLEDYDLFNFITGKKMFSLKFINWKMLSSLLKKSEIMNF